MWCQNRCTYASSSNNFPCPAYHKIEENKSILKEDSRVTEHFGSHYKPTELSKDLLLIDNTEKEKQKKKGSNARKLWTGEIDEKAWNEDYLLPEPAFVRLLFPIFLPALGINNFQPLISEQTAEENLRTQHTYKKT